MNRTRSYRLYKRQIKIKYRLKQSNDLLGKIYVSGLKHVGAYNKTHFRDCGKPKCLYCHYEKIFNVRKQINIQGILNEY